MIHDLIEKMVTPDEPFLTDSSENVSWKAYREAEEIGDETLIPVLAEFIESLRNQKSKAAREKRDAAYFILKCIGENISDKRVPNILMESIECETNMYTLMYLLDWVKVQENYVPDYKKIMPFLEDKRWQVRLSAIELLGKCKDVAVDDALLEILASSNDRFEIHVICNALHYINPEKAIPLLVEKTKHSDREVRSTCYKVLNMIGNSRLLPIFIEGLNDRYYCSKYYALIGVCEFDDGKHADLVYKSVNKIFTSKRILENDENGPTDLMHALKYLDVYLYEKQKMELIRKKIRKSDEDFLSDQERDFIREFYKE